MSAASMISFLDLVCCAFGGAMLVFLIATSAETPGGPAPPGSLVIVRCKPPAGKEPRGEVGIEFRRPGQTTWERALPGDQARHQLSATSEPNGGSDALLVLLQPDSGTWEFRPYLVNSPKGSEDPVRVDIEVLGEGVTAQGDMPAPLPMRVGEGGQILRVRMARKANAP